MRPLGVAIAFVGAAIVTVLAAPPAQAHRHACSLRGARVVQHDRGGRLLYRGSAYDYYACLYSRGRMVPIGYDVLDVKLASPYVLHEDDTTGGSGVTSSELDLLNLRTGDEPVVHYFSESVDRDTGNTYLGQLALTHRGTVVWLQNTETQTGWARSVELYHRHHRATLDAGPLVDRGSLRLSRHGRTLRWTNAGEPRSARLP